MLRLRAGLTELFPELRDVGYTHSWFGNVAMNRDMLPRMFEKDGVLYASGFCGSGVVWAPWLGRRAAQRHREEHAKQPTEQSDQRRLDVAELCPLLHQDERRQREDDSRRERLLP